MPLPQIHKGLKMLTESIREGAKIEYRFPTKGLRKGPTPVFLCRVVRVVSCTESSTTVLYEYEDPIGMWTKDPSPLKVQHALRVPDRPSKVGEWRPAPADTPVSPAAPAACAKPVSTPKVRGCDAGPSHAARRSSSESSGSDSDRPPSGKRWKPSQTGGITLTKAIVSAMIREALTGADGLVASMINEAFSRRTADLERRMEVAESSLARHESALELRPPALPAADPKHAKVTDCWYTKHPQPNKPCLNQNSESTVRAAFLPPRLIQQASVEHRGHRAPQSQAAHADLQQPGRAEHHLSALFEMLDITDESGAVIGRKLGPSKGTGRLVSWARCKECLIQHDGCVSLMRQMIVREQKNHGNCLFCTSYLVDMKKRPDRLCGECRIKVVGHVLERDIRRHDVIARLLVTPVIEVTGYHVEVETSEFKIDGYKVDYRVSAYKLRPDGSRPDRPTHILYLELDKDHHDLADRSRTRRIGNYMYEQRQAQKTTGLWQMLVRYNQCNDYEDADGVKRQTAPHLRHLVLREWFVGWLRHTESAPPTAERVNGYPRVCILFLFYADRRLILEGLSASVYGPPELPSGNGVDWNGMGPFWRKSAENVIPALPLREMLDSVPAWPGVVADETESEAEEGGE